jgi:hypothetical protein
MTLFDLINLISLVVYIGTAVVIFVGRNWLKTRIEKGVQHHFDERLEGLRSELRKTEELLKSDLQAKETEIATLRSSVLSGSAARQALLDKRRFEAVEKVWRSVQDYGHSLHHLSSTVSHLNYETIANAAR